MVKEKESPEKESPEEAAYNWSLSFLRKNGKLGLTAIRLAVREQMANGMKKFLRDQEQPDKRGLFKTVIDYDARTLAEETAKVLEFDVELQVANELASAEGEKFRVLIKQSRDQLGIEKGNWGNTEGMRTAHIYYLKSEKAWHDIVYNVR